MVNYAIERADAKTAQTLARHKSADLTMNVYGRANAEKLRGTVEELGKALGEAACSRNSPRGVQRAALPLAAGAESARIPLEGAGLAAASNGWGARIRT